MLMLLHIENIAVIEKADITFQNGFNALTGETGAGKSIIIDALGAVLGQRVSRDLVRSGEKSASVSAMFCDLDELVPLLQELGAEPDEDGMLLLQREIQSDGKSLCRINGRPCTAAQLRQIGTNLLNIHGQHDGQQLLDEKQHLRYLDRFGRVEAVYAAYAGRYHAMRALQRDMDALQMDEKERERRIETLRREIEELERAQLKTGEEEALLERRNLLRNGEKYSAAVEGADYCLSGSENVNGAVSQVEDAENALGGIRQLGDSYAQLLERLVDVRHELYDIAETVRDMKLQFDFSPEELDDVEGRLDQLYRLKKKYGPTVEDMLAYLDGAKQELDEIQCADDTLARLSKKYAAAQEEVLAAAGALSAARRAAASDLQARILQELRDLDMAKVRFEIAFSKKAPESDGQDQVQFMMSANPGEELRPIHKIASGGELARIMLALKNVLAETDHVGTLVFDEVDTGVSGRAAQKVAEKMASVSRRKQVLCVTHLPQIAAMADAHFSVEKAEELGRTRTRVTLLDRRQRAQELARITGGAHITEALLKSAEEMLDAAERYRRELARA